AHQRLCRGVGGSAGGPLGAGARGNAAFRSTHPHCRLSGVDRRRACAGAHHHALAGETGAMSAPTPRIGFIGLGVMGAPMARNLASAGYHLSVFDADPTRAPAIAGDRISAATDLRALAAGSDIVITMLPNGEVVNQVVAEGLAHAMTPGALLLDTSSSEPWLTRRSAEILGTRDVAMVDAPVSGAQWGAEAA